MPNSKNSRTQDVKEGYLATNPHCRTEERARRPALPPFRDTRAPNRGICTQRTQQVIEGSPSRHDKGA
jgi:hypothetical protein